MKINIDIISLFQKLRANTPGDMRNNDTRYVLDKTISNPQLIDFNIGTIMMESLSRFNQLSDSPSTNFNVGLTIYEMWRLFNLGYIHGDPHTNNIMFNPFYDYIEGRRGRVILLDFGATFRHNLPLIPAERMIEVADAQINHTSHLWTANKALSHPGYQWLNITDPIRRAAMIIELNDIHANRELLKIKFAQHVMQGIIPNLNPGIIHVFNDPLPHITTFTELSAAVNLLINTINPNANLLGYTHNSNSPNSSNSSEYYSLSSNSPNSSEYYSLGGKKLKRRSKKDQKENQ